VLEFVSHYYPNVLEAMRTRWISPQIVSTNRLDAAGLRRAQGDGPQGDHDAGHRDLATHMEWFYGPKGLKFSEIGCAPARRRRSGTSTPPATTSTSIASGRNAVVHGKIEPSPRASTPRHHRAAPRPRRPHPRLLRGRARGDPAEASAQWIIDAHLPPPGTPTQPIEAGYMANAWIRMRHPDYDAMREIFEVIGRTIRVRAG
jgi:hypothetical protein